MTYTITDTLPDAEDMAKEWLLSVPSVVSAVGLNRSGVPNIYLGRPKGSPLPAIDFYRAGGLPTDSEVPIDEARISFNCWGANRPVAKAVAKALVNAAQSLKGSVWTSSTGARIHGAKILLELFLPDPGDSSTPRYVVDIQLTITAA